MSSHRELSFGFECEITGMECAELSNRKVIEVKRIFH